MDSKTGEFDIKAAQRFANMARGQGFGREGLGYLPHRVTGELSRESIIRTNLEK